MTYRGVDKLGKKYRAEISIDSKRVHLGMFKIAKKAAKAYDKAAIKYHGDKAKVNFGRKLTIIEEQVYKLIAGDFYNLSYENAAKLMPMTRNNIGKAIKRIWKKCPSLFPLRMPYPKLSSIPSYKTWMDSIVVRKF